MKTISSTILLGCVAMCNGCTSTSEQSEKKNVLLIIIDDMGYSDLASFGGEINTPNINMLAEQGTRYTRFHTSSLSAPTRSMILTGVDNHSNGIGAMPPTAFTSQYLQPGYEGQLNDRVATIAEILNSQLDYYTFTAGKWHIGDKEHSCPSSRGFDHSFSLMGGGGSHFSDAFTLFAFDQPVTYYREDGKRIDQLPEDFYSTTVYTEHILEYLDNAPKDRPFFGYISMTAPHDPLHIIDEWREKYRGVYDKGYDHIRETRHKRQIELGIIPASTPYYPIEERWDELTPEQQLEQARTMEVYAAMIDYLDYSIGRIIDKLKSNGEYENTLIFVVSDNGANSKDSYEYPGNSKEMLAEMYDNSIENYGRFNSFIAQGKAWAGVSNNPYSGYKETMNEGGNCTPLIISGGDFAKSKIDNTSLIHVTDIAPTIFNYVGAEYRFEGRDLAPLYGRAIDPSGVDVRGENDTVCFEIDENKSAIRGYWKVLQNTKSSGGDGVNWRLYNLKDDVAEMNDLSQQYPEIKRELIAEWEKYAREVGYVAAEGDPAMMILTAEEYYSYDPKNLEKF